MPYLAQKLCQGAWLHDTVVYEDGLVFARAPFAVEANAPDLDTVE